MGAELTNHPARLSRTAKYTAGRTPPDKSIPPQDRSPCALVFVVRSPSSPLHLPRRLRAQMPAGGPPAQEEKAHAIENGGIFVPGWKATVDAGAVKQGQSEKDSSFKSEGGGFHVMTGPALTYWNPKNMATGDYTVMATFSEPHYMNRNDHPHPYGLFIAGNDMGTPAESGLYCAAYGNGRFIVRGFGPAPFQMNGRGEANDAVHKATGPDQPVSQMIAIQVEGRFRFMPDQWRNGRHLQEG